MNLHIKRPRMTVNELGDMLQKNGQFVIADARIRR
jgi:hypothetical protein